ncbi:MAG: FHA domain-containing protein, partial [Anaerolineae bacterium]|nr:FHA domain-containing protein [Anaerolineae bacterium]
TATETPLPTITPIPSITPTPTLKPSVLEDITGAEVDILDENSDSTIFGGMFFGLVLLGGATAFLAFTRQGRRMTRQAVQGSTEIFSRVMTDIIGSKGGGTGASGAKLGELRVIQGASPTTIDITRNTFVVGRDYNYGCHYAFEKLGYVSGRHFTIYYEHETGQFYIEDQNSSNGTDLDHQPLPPAQRMPLHTGAIISIANQLQMEFKPNLDAMPSTEVYVGSNASEPDYPHQPFDPASDGGAVSHMAQPPTELGDEPLDDGGMYGDILSDVARQKTSYQPDDEQASTQRRKRTLDDIDDYM